MSSLDVTSLFTNIPLKETTDIICNELFKNKELINGMDKSVFREFLTVAMTETYFIFDGNLYKQCDGVLMGSPLGPTFANSFLSFHEKNWILECPEEIKPIKYKRYVDDIFILCRDQEHHRKFLEYMNTRHENITFTEELEVNNTLSFLDVAITRTDEGFVTNLYRKNTFSGVFTNFFSFLSIQYKASLVSTLLFRCFHLSSSTTIFHQEVERLRSILAKNSFPLEFVDQCVASFLNKMFKRRKNNTSEEEKHTETIVLPYLGKLSLEIRKRLRKYVNKHITNCNLVVIFRSQRRLRTLFRYKDTIPTNLQSYIIYRYTCGTCKDSYIGKTDRHCLIRWCEHLKITPKRGNPSKNKAEPTAVREHTLATEHPASLDNFEIIGRERSRNDFKLKIKESLLIKKHRPKLNDNDQSIPLSLF